jgi:hypothetical protein
VSLLSWFHRHPAPHGSDEAQAANVEATRALRDAEALTCRADDVADRLAEKNARNHFAEAFARAIRGV